jgi:hypothetical protein
LAPLNDRDGGAEQPDDLVGELAAGGPMSMINGSSSGPASSRASICLCSRPAGMKCSWRPARRSAIRVRLPRK